MKELHITKLGTPQGDIDFKCLFRGKVIAVLPKSGNINNEYYQQFIKAYRAKGVTVVEKRQGVLVNFFPAENRPVKLGSIEIDPEQDSDLVIEDKLCQFYIDTFSKGGFKVE